MVDCGARNQLENALVNLAFNVRDVLPSGGKVSIKTANCYLHPAYVANLTEPVERGDHVMIAVTDDRSSRHYHYARLALCRRVVESPVGTAAKQPATWFAS